MAAEEGYPKSHSTVGAQTGKGTNEAAEGHEPKGRQAALDCAVLQSFETVPTLLYCIDMAHSYGIRMRCVTVAMPWGGVCWLVGSDDSFAPRGSFFFLDLRLFLVVV